MLALYSQPIYPTWRNFHIMGLSSLVLWKDPARCGKALPELSAGVHRERRAWG